MIAGPVEATVFGNVLVQARSHGEIRTLADIRSVVRESAEMTQYEPADAPVWSEARGRLRWAKKNVCKPARIIATQSRTCSKLANCVNAGLNSV